MNKWKAVLADPAREFMFGDRNINPSQGAVVLSIVRGCRFQLRSAGRIASITAYVKELVPGALSRAAIYDDVAGEPVNLLAYSDNLVSPNVWEWFRYPMLANPFIDLAYYWFMLQTEEYLYFRYTAGETNQWVSTEDYWFDGFDDPFDKFERAQYADVRMSIYATILRDTLKGEIKEK